MPFITITGVDHTISPDILFSLAKAHSTKRFAASQIEWGVLYSSKNAGRGRYPDIKWIEKLAERLAQPGYPSDDQPSFALHICSDVRGFLSGEGIVSDLAKVFPRVQINFRSDKYDPASIRECFLRNSHQTLITQHNPVNEPLLQHLSGIPNHAILFDRSGGNGITPETWTPAIPHIPCGWAGGLGPLNLKKDLGLIHQASGGRPYWVDMEGRLRDDQDLLRWVRVKQCLGVAARFHHDLFRHPNLDPEEALTDMDIDGSSNIDGAKYFYPVSF